jgi:Flp pilus assembly protein TadD
MSSWVLAAVLAISAPAMEIDSQIEPPAQVMVLPPDLRARLQQDVLAGSPSQRTRLNRLLHLVFDKDGLGLAYQDDATGSVAQVYATRTANCLSFTLMFIALAREAGLDAQPQEIPETLGWHEDNGVFYRVDHINAIVRISGTDYLVDIARNSVIALRKPEPVSDQQLLAHFYNNLAMRDLEQGRIAPALAIMDTALELDPRNATYWSNAGVLYLRNDDETDAQRAYTKALALNPANTSALANMANLAQRDGDHDLEAKLRDRLERQQQSDPFFHFIEAEGYLQAGDYAHAIEHYQRAIHLHGDEPRFYAALAHAHALAGDTRQAIRALSRAEWLSTDTARADYKSQIDALRNH